MNILKTFTFWILLGVISTLIGVFTINYFDFAIYILYFGVCIMSFNAIIFILSAFRNMFADWTCNKSKVVIKMGKYRPFMQIPLCLPSFMRTTKVYYSKTIKFTKSAITNTSHIHKLFGFAVGLKPNPHYDSFRIGWRTIDNKTLQIISYYYIEGVNYHEILVDNIDLATSYKLTIHRNDKGIIFEAINIFTKKITKNVIPYESNNIVGWKLGFYYEGEGEQPAPHNIEFLQL